VESYFPSNISDYLDPKISFIIFPAGAESRDDRTVILDSLPTVNAHSVNGIGCGAGAKKWNDLIDSCAVCEARSDEKTTSTLFINKSRRGINSVIAIS
jgi:hypothetical protein